MGCYLGVWLPIIRHIPVLLWPEKTKNHYSCGKVENKLIAYQNHQLLETDLIINPPPPPPPANYCYHIFSLTVFFLSVWEATTRDVHTALVVTWAWASNSVVDLHHFEADPDAGVRIRIRLITLMRNWMPIRIFIWCGCGSWTDFSPWCWSRSGSRS